MNDEAAMVENKEVTRMPLGQLNPAPYNPRTITPSMLAALKANITRYGFIQPVVVQREGMVIIGGHQRVRALRELLGDAADEHDVPCVVLDIDDVEAKRLNIALNKVEGDFDAMALSTLLAEVAQDDTDALARMGFDAKEAAQYIGDFQPVSDDEEGVRLDELHGPHGGLEKATIVFSTREGRDRFRSYVNKLAKDAGEGVHTGDAVLTVLEC